MFDGKEVKRATSEVRITRQVMSVEDREAIRRLARENALRLGMTEAQWERHRRGGYSVGKDILMALDPEGERPIRKGTMMMMRRKARAGAHHV